VELENFNLYLSTLFLVTVIALYFAFRGTLTANFTFVPPAQWIGRLHQYISASNQQLQVGAQFAHLSNSALPTSRIVRWVLCEARFCEKSI